MKRKYDEDVDIRINEKLLASGYENNVGTHMEALKDILADVDKTSFVDLSTQKQDFELTSKRAKALKLDTNLVCSDKGVKNLADRLESFEFDSRVSTKDNLMKLMEIFELWAHQLHPKLSFTDFLSKMSLLGTNKKIKNQCSEVALGQTNKESFEEDLIENGISLRDQFDEAEYFDETGKFKEINRDEDDFDKNIELERDILQRDLEDMF